MKFVVLYTNSRLFTHISAHWAIKVYVFVKFYILRGGSRGGSLGSNETPFRSLVYTPAVREERDHSRMRGFYQLF